ncbi:hypothetical protein VHEMI10740 [[Torrubiella] hemipterigena]|uniref:Uncharacterized protein n=1 Tax=[Torrubiella] hemipterigena TaxID=1531966 RepID=A0A0A1TJH9_9HYPO|nr:hypothetical protein VHEMI10740 [[Torrubiella] hemipterigena]
MTTHAIRRPPNRCSYATGTVADLAVSAELQHQRRTYDLDAEYPVVQHDELMVLDISDEPQADAQPNVIQLDDNDGTEDPFFTPPPNETEPQQPVILSSKDLQESAASFAKLAQARYDDETMAYGLILNAIQESLKLLRNEKQTKIIKTALSNIPRYWPA